MKRPCILWEEWWIHLATHIARMALRTITISTIIILILIIMIPTLTTMGSKLVHLWTIALKLFHTQHGCGRAMAKYIKQLHDEQVAGHYLRLLLVLYMLLFFWLMSLIERRAHKHTTTYTQTKEHSSVLLEMKCHSWCFCTSCVPVSILCYWISMGQSIVCYNTWMKDKDLVRAPFGQPYWKRRRWWRFSGHRKTPDKRKKKTGGAKNNYDASMASYVGGVICV